MQIAFLPKFVFYQIYGLGRRYIHTTRKSRRRTGLPTLSPPPKMTRNEYLAHGQKNNMTRFTC
jgi:hypothetical protein